jgi:hypothetical protein
VIGAPPVLLGAVQVSATCPSPAVPVTLVGALGAVPDGVTALDAADDGPEPLALAATTVKVYAVPFVRPVTVAVTAPFVDAVRPPGLDVTV